MVMDVQELKLCTCQLYGSSWSFIYYCAHSNYLNILISRTVCFFDYFAFLMGWTGQMLLTILFSQTVMCWLYSDTIIKMEKVAGLVPCLHPINCKLCLLWPTWFALDRLRAPFQWGLSRVTTNIRAKRVLDSERQYWQLFARRSRTLHFPKQATRRNKIYILLTPTDPL